MRKSKALALWGGGGLLAVSAGAGAILVSNASAAPASGGTAATASTSAGSTTSSGTTSAVSTSSNNGNSGNGNSGNGGGNGAGTGSPGKALTVTGTAAGVLAPGRDDRVTVTISNPNSSDILVTRVTGVVTGVSGAAGPGTLPACNAAWYLLRDFTGSQRVLANKSGTVQMVVHFDNQAINQDRCKGAKYTFNFNATANQA